MTDLELKFKKAVYLIRNGPARDSTNEEKLKVYGLFKQATLGDNTTAQPWSVQFEASAKWNAWSANKGMSRDDAMKSYCKILDEQDSNWEKNPLLADFKPESVTY